MERLIGVGGMGEVYLGHDDALGRTVAIKQIRAQQAADETTLARFRREARTLAAVDHPGVVSIHTIGTTPSGALYLAMEYVDGVALSTVCAGPWPIALAAGLVRQAAAALGATHAAGIVHRDVKPDNLLLDARGQVRVVDFGLARRPDSATDQVTADNIIIGTVPYMAPEQLMGAAVGPTADVFALGIVLYQLVTGVHPFVRDSHSATAVAIAALQHPPIRTLRSDLPEALAQLVDGCLSAEPRYRPADGAKLACALTPWITDTLDADLARVVADPARFIATMPPTWTPSAAPTLTARPSPRPVSVTDPTDPPLPAQSTEQAPIVLDEPPDPLARKPRRAWAALGLVGLAAAVACLALFWPDAQVGPTPDTAVDAALTVTAPIAQLQTIAILNFDGPDADHNAVLADRVRVHLDTLPEARLRVVALTGLMRSVWPETPIDGRLDPTLLRRDPGALGAIDLAIAGAVDGSTLSLRATRLSDGAAAWTRSVDLPADPTEAVAAVSKAIADALNLPAPPQPPAAVSVAAYTAYLTARAAERRNDYSAIDDALTRAFELDPDLIEARCMHLGWLRGVGRIDELLTIARRLLDSGKATPRQRALLEANLAFADADKTEAVRKFEAITRRWPFYVDAQNTLLALRFHFRGVKDLAAVERLARRALAFFPRGEHAASRLVRAMAFRGRADEAKAALLAGGLTPEPRLSNDVWAEVYLYTGDYARADARFSDALRRAPHDLYARNMRYVAQILAGRCADATPSILNDLSEFELNEELAKAGWTVHLGLQALACQADWAGAQTLLTRWNAQLPATARPGAAW